MNGLCADWTPVLLGDWMQYIFGPLMFLTAIFLILLVLVQRGRGGGLAGAFGGMGGQSAFGTKAGDTFTRITMIVAAVWILLSIACIKLINESVRPLPAEPPKMRSTDTDRDKDAKDNDASTPGEFGGQGAKDSSPE